MTAPILNLVPEQGMSAPLARQHRMLGEILVRDFGVTPDSVTWALDRQRRGRRPLGSILIAHGMADEDTIFEALAIQSGAGRVDRATAIVAPEQIDCLGLERCARLRLLPLGRAGAVTRIATSQPHKFAAHRAWLTDALGPVALCVASDSDLDQMLVAARRHALVNRAETRVDIRQSCRSLDDHTSWRPVMAFGAVVAMTGLLAPTQLFTALAFVALAILLLNTILAAYATWARPPPSSGEENDPLILAHMPTVSVLVPLHKERHIATALIERLKRLDYPRELLDICLVIEAGDKVTRTTIAETELPPWIRCLSVDEGRVKTKPRAMNYALDFCQGSIVGIYDAEDDPAPDQLLRVVRQFAAAGPDVACIQGRLNFYNPDASWITRCFSIDYATWFNLGLPSLARLGWPIPLGGTTLFMRRQVLEDIGAWDSHNVTEDADLGMRLARRGYQTQLLDSTTMEEATQSPRAWIRQRSRWLKGYAVTYAVHMRHPRQLLDDLGWWRFAGFQMLFLGVLCSVALAPVLWSFWLLLLGLPHPWSGALTPASSVALTVFLVGCSLIFMLSNLAALHSIGRTRLMRWIPIMQLYYPLATISLVKGLVELAVCPFFWDKTDHGISAPKPARARVQHRAADGSRTLLKYET